MDGAYGRDLKTLLSAAERATRELWGRIPPPSQHQQLLAQLSQRAALTNAVTRLRENQDRAAQAAAARRAGERVRLIAAQPPPLHPSSRRRPPGRESGRRGGLSTSAGPDRSGPGTS